MVMILLRFHRHCPKVRFLLIILRFRVSVSVHIPCVVSGSVFPKDGVFDGVLWESQILQLTFRFSCRKNKLKYTILRLGSQSRRFWGTLSLIWNPYIRQLSVSFPIRVYRLHIFRGIVETIVLSNPRQDESSPFFCIDYK